MLARMAGPLGLLGVWAVACGPGQRPIVPLPAHGGGGGPDALIGGVRVAGDAATGCVWLEGDSGGRTSVLWPPGFGARFGPLELVGPDGTVFAREGDTIALGGAEIEGAVALRCRVSRAVWFATGVAAVNGVAVDIPSPGPLPPRTPHPIMR